MLLNNQQKQIIELLRQGLTYEQMSKTLHISKETVKKRISQLLEITGTTNSTHLVNSAWENNIVNRSIKVDGPNEFK